MNEDLRRKILGWINIGPLGTIEGREHEMRLAVEALGEGAVDMVLDLLVEAEADRGDVQFFDTALELGQMYAARFPNAMASVGMSRLSAHGPASVICVLGSTGERRIVPRLLEVIDTRRASIDVVIELVDCLAELGGGESREALEGLRGREGLDAAVVEEIEIALRVMERDQG